MSTKTSVKETRSARERLLAAADELFYKEGINTVGIDRVIEHAGVAKASLYDCFGSKEELIRAYLASRHEARKARVIRKLARFDAPREKLLAVFDAVGDFMLESNFRGCAFLRASAEARTGSSVKSICDESRTWLRTLFADLARDAGAADPGQLARQLVILYDGASAAAQMDRDPGAAAAARAAASLMLDAATSSPRKSPTRVAKRSRG